MVDFKWMTGLLFVMQLLQFTVTSLHSYTTVRHGDDVTFPCENMTNQDKCKGTTWLFSNPKDTAAVPLIELGQIKTESNSKSDRLSVTGKCSLVIKKVTEEDVGHYTCRQFEKEGGRQQGSDSEVHLSVVTMTEHKDGDRVTLNCSVRTHGHCRGSTVRWMLNGQKVDKDKGPSQTSCSASVNISTAQCIENSENYSCYVTNETEKAEQFPFRCQSSDEETVEWWHMTVPVLSAGLVSAGVCLIWTKRRGKNAHVDDNKELNLNSAESQCVPESPEATVDPEVGVSYVSISFSGNRRSEIPNKDAQSDAVTYSTVKAPSSPPDPSILYATIK